MKIAWLTDAQAPYREPMWREIAARADFHVFFTFREEKVRHWVWRETADYRSTVVRAWVVPLPHAVARRLDEPAAALKPGVAGQVLAGVDALVIQLWWQPANLWCIARARMARIPYILYAESTMQTRQFSGGPAAWVRTLVFSNAGAVLVPGAAAAEAAVSDGAAPARVVETVNSIDVDLFRSRMGELRRNATDIAEDGIHRFVCIGQLIERKNVGTLIRAFAAVGDKATLDIAGDGVELESLKAVARECAVEDRVRFHGFLGAAEVLDLLSRTHTLVLPSTEEVFGFTALEAHVAGLQVIVSARAGIAPNLSGRSGTWIVEPTVDDVRRALDEAQSQWSGWQDDVDVEFASPRRAALDLIRAVAIARSPMPRR